MSGIAGIFNLDGRPVDTALLRRMTSAMAHRGPDGASHWFSGPVGFGHRMLHTTPESLLEQQPLTDETGTLCLTFDGRVDNGAELRKTLEAKGARLRSDCDAELVLRAYECWGEQAPAKLLGDFAFALWDGRNRQLFCARDSLGVKPFYYYSDGQRFLFASELHALLLDPSLRRVPNEGLVGEYLANAFVNREETLFQDILRLPQATALVVLSDGRIRKAEYWRADPGRETRYKDDAEYAEAFREVFEETVRCRLRSHLPVASELSGGLDSSSIASVAESLRRRGAVSSPGLETFSLVFPGLPCDESSYIGAVTGKWGLASNRLEEAAPDPQGYYEQVGKYQECPYPPNGQMHHPLMRAARSKGMRVMLSGSWGDQWLTGSLDHSADLLRRMRFGKLLRQVRDDSHIMNQLEWPESPAYMLLRYGVWPTLPRSVRRRVKTVLRGERGGVPRWIGHEFASRTQLADRISRRDAAIQHWPSLAQRELEGYIVSGKSSFGSEATDRFAASYGMEVRYPFQDRRLIEFAIALPEDQRWRGRETKFILRQAMREILPETVLRRTTKADFSHVLVRAMQSLCGEDLIDSMEIARAGWVDGQQVRLLYQAMLSDYANGRTPTWTVPLWFIFGMELWKRQVFPGSAIPEKEFAAAPAGQPLAAVFENN